MEKTIYFDMDGTIADLYNVPDWLKYLRSEDPFPYKEAIPLVNMEELEQLLIGAQLQGYALGIISWLSLDSSNSFKKETRQAKKDWLKKFFPNIFWDEIHLIQYGTRKSYAAKNPFGLLIDDNDEVLSHWDNFGGEVLNAKKEDWLNSLKEIIERGK